MLYTIAGAIIGGTTAWVACKLCDTDLSRGYAPSSGQYLIIMGTILGAGIGFGVGSTRLLSGHYYFTKID